MAVVVAAAVVVAVEEAKYEYDVVDSLANRIERRKEGKEVLE